MRIFEIHEFKTQIYEGHISFDQKKVLQTLKSADPIIQQGTYMRTSFLKEKNILLYTDFKKFLSSERVKRNSLSFSFLATSNK